MNPTANPTPDQIIDQLRREIGLLKIRCFDAVEAARQLEEALSKIAGASGLENENSIEALIKHVYLLAHPEEREQLEKDIAQAQAEAEAQAQAEAKAADKAKRLPINKV